MLRNATNDALAYLSEPSPTEDREWLMNGERNLWCAGLLGLAVGRKVQHAGHDVAGFAPVDVCVNESGIVSYGQISGAHRVMRFTITDPANFAAAVTAATAQLLAQFPLVRK